MQFIAGSTVNGGLHFIKDGVKGTTWNKIKVKATADTISLFINDVCSGVLPNLDRPQTPEIRACAGDQFHKAANAKIRSLVFHNSFYFCVMN